MCLPHKLIPCHFLPACMQAQSPLGLQNNHKDCCLSWNMENKCTHSPTWQKVYSCFETRITFWLIPFIRETFRKKLSQFLKKPFFLSLFSIFAEIELFPVNIIISAEWLGNIKDFYHSQETWISLGTQMLDLIVQIGFRSTSKRLSFARNPLKI